jgi:hypothetical protein
LVWVACAALFAHATARADFVLVEDFEGLMPGPIHQQGGWIAESPNSVVTDDPAGGTNQVLAVSTESTHLHREVVILNGTIRMLFLRFRYASQLNFSMGMSDVSNPDRFDHFESELSMTNASSELRINDDGTYEVLSVLDPDTWYNCWLLIDNANDQTQVWLHARAGEGATAADQLDADGQTVFQFRNSSAGNLVNFFIKTGGGSGPSGPLYLDDLYLESTNALNLRNPAAAPTGVGAADAPVPPVSLGAPRPNPLHPVAIIPFTIASDGAVDLGIYDAAGRLVRRLFAGSLASGNHTMSWDGRDETGQRLPSGQYFCTLEVDGFPAGTQKITILK